MRALTSVLPRRAGFRSPIRAIVATAVSAALLSAGVAVFGASAVVAQTVTPTVAPTVAPTAAPTSAPPTTVSPIDIRMNAVVQTGSTASSLPIGGQILQVVVTNSGTTPIANQQIVVRVPVSPAVITQVTEQNLPVGVIDAKSGFWYHTIAQLNVGASLTYIVTWYTPCPGRWGLAARVGDRRTQVSVQLVGTAQTNCSPDEFAQPATASYGELPWPPLALALTTTTAPITTPTTPVSPTLPGSVTSTTTPGAVPPPVVTTTTTTLPVTTTTVKKSTTSTVIVCKTVGGRRYCGAQSSVYKPGQKKVVESKPKTTKKTVKKKK